MNKTLQALIAATCLVVIACGGWWMYDRNAARVAANRAEDARQMIAVQKLERASAEREAASKIALEKEIQSCRYDLAARDKGNIVFFVQRAKGGGDMMDEVRKCEALVNSSKPSE